MADAAPGTHVVLGPGQFEGSDTLIIPTAITLGGKDTTLKFYGDGPVLSAKSGRDIVLNDITIDASEANIATREFPNLEPIDPPASEKTVRWGLVWLDAIDAPKVSGLTITGCGDTVHGLCISNSSAVSVEGTEVSNARSGICLFSSHDSQIIANRCHNNRAAGIVLFSSESEALEQNECWGNGSV
ncbi:right-handed parallel beta-helix repeat-containing protein, partial [uncultured Shimia sp.]|uniref:right-handed parallel beta-helix repeat-containing protein n=1 Tax=uncultured Shimia sp. TaxID=573152 RepID=UPI0025DF719F